MNMTESIKTKTGRKWWLIAALSAFALIVITGAALYFIFRKSSTVDQVVILTVPSGARVTLDSKEYGISPVKLEQVPVGTYTITITKDDFDTITEQITISQSQQPIEFRLTKRLPGDLSSLSIEELQRRAEEAFAAGRYVQTLEDSAWLYTEMIRREDPDSEFVKDMFDRIRKALHEVADSAIKRGDFVLARETYSQLIAYYPEDKDAQIALAKLDNQLSARKGEVADLIRKAEDALRRDNLIEPKGANAYEFIREALAIDPRNDQAQAIKLTIRDRLMSISDQMYKNGEAENAIKYLQRVKTFFPGDSQIVAQLREWDQKGAGETPKPPDPKAARIAGLKNHLDGRYAEAIPQLELAMTNNLGTPEVIYALADSYWKTGVHSNALVYFRQVPSYAGQLYTSSVAAQGDIALDRGDSTGALRRFKEARELGGSTLYTLAKLNDRIERIENVQRAKAEAPKDTAIFVKHSHGGIFGDRSCEGWLTVNGAGVSYKGNEHNYSANLVAVGVSVKKDELTVTGLLSKSLKFKVSFSEAERFREELSKWQISARK